MSVIESLIYERYSWIQNGISKTMYICVPATLIVMGDTNPKTQFIFWN
jgi:hypothetical protein